MNFDTTNGLVFPRVSRVTIEFDEDGNGSAQYVERKAVLIDGQVRYLRDDETYHQISVAAADMQSPVPMVNPVTGADIGQDTNGQMLYLVLMAFIRADQKARYLA